MPFTSLAGLPPSSETPGNPYSVQVAAGEAPEGAVAGAVAVAVTVAGGAVLPVGEAPGPVDPGPDPHPASTATAPPAAARPATARVLLLRPVHSVMSKNSFQHGDDPASATPRTPPATPGLTSGQALVRGPGRWRLRSPMPASRDPYRRAT